MALDRRPRIHKRVGYRVLCWGDSDRLDGKPTSDSWGEVTCGFCLKKRRPFVRAKGGGVEIAMSNGGVAIVDEEDFEGLAQWSWSRHLMGNHAKRSRREGDKIRTVYMHREIMGFPPKGVEVDHINGNGLDNRRCNLRLATPSQNSSNQKRKRSNTSGYKGVCYNKRNKKWQVSINCKPIGQYNSALEAAKAYDAAARKLHGEFARLNFPDER